MSAESELLIRCRRGDPEAWDQLFDQHYEAAGRFVCQLGAELTCEDIEEICQETFLAVIRNLNSFDGRSQFQTWLFRIAANKAKDYRARQSAAKRGGGVQTVSLNASDQNGGDAPPIDPPSQAPGPDTVLMAREQHDQVRVALDRLGEPCQEIVELRYFGGLSYEEISASLELNPKTVSSRLSKCLDRLEAILAGSLSREKSAVFPSNS
jgi:RNA polymerase sigma-70 factor (ECF subfamily)